MLKSRSWTCAFYMKYKVCLKYFLFMIVVHSFPGNQFMLLDFSNILWEEKSYHILVNTKKNLNCDFLLHKTSSCPSSYLNTNLITLPLRSLTSLWFSLSVNEAGVCPNLNVKKIFVSKKKLLETKSQIIFCAQKIGALGKFCFRCKLTNAKNSRHSCNATHGVIVILPVCY